MSKEAIPMHQLPALARMLREARIKAHLTCEALAKASGVEPEVIYRRMEEATLMPARSTLRRLCETLNLDYDGMLDDLRDKEDGEEEQGT